MAYFTFPHVEHVWSIIVGVARVCHVSDSVRMRGRYNDNLRQKYEKWRRTVPDPNKPLLTSFTQVRCQQARKDSEGL